jgi:hypothetical protein
MPVARRWLHMLPSDLAADLVMSLAPYAYYASVDMATHGTPNDYDARPGDSTAHRLRRANTTSAQPSPIWR